MARSLTDSGAVNSVADDLVAEEEPLVVVPKKKRRRTADLLPAVGVFIIFIGLWYAYHYSLPSYKQWVVPLPHDVLLHGFTEKDNPQNPLSLIQGVLITGRVTGESSLASEAEKQLAGPRFLMATLTGFALFAALLAIIGIYGVTAYAVQQREREVAIRMAIGATPGAIIRMFLKQGSLVLAVGIVCGLFAAAAVARMLANQLHGVQPFDVPTLLGACAFMALAGLLANWWPARRAAAKNPMASLNEN